MGSERSVAVGLRPRSARKPHVALVAVLMLVATACAANPAPSGASNAPSGPAASQAPTKIRVGIAGSFLPLAPVYIAKSKGYFAEEGLDAEIINTPSLQCLTGLVSGELQIAGCGATDMMVAAEKGERLLAIANITPTVHMTLYLRNDVATRLKLTQQSPLKDRLSALKGLTLSVTGVGGLANQTLNMMIREAGLKETDVKIVPIAAQGAQLAALIEKQIDGIVGGPPLNDQVEIGGIATILVYAKQLPIMSEMLYEAMFTTPAWAEASPAAARGAVRAMVKANTYLRTNADAPAHLNATDYKGVSTEVLTLSLGRIKQEFPADACLTAGQAAGLVKFANAVGILTKTLDTAEGSFWTNKYNEGCKK
jgi:NitT/TauT family transport system substrate-binding protein